MSLLSIHSVSVMTQIFFINCQQHWKYDRTMNTGANAHGKRAVSTLDIATSDRLDLRWQLGFQWHGIGIEIVLQVPRLFHNATVSQCDHFLLLHMYMYLLFETSPGWRGFFKLNFVQATELQCIYYLCRILISRPPRVFRRFKRRSCCEMQCLQSVRLWFNSTSPTEEFTYLGLSDLSLLNTEQVLGLIQYHIRSPVAIFCQASSSLPIALKFDRHLCSTDWFLKKSGTSISTSNHMGLRLCDIFQHDLLWDIKTGLRQQHTKLMVTWVKSVATAIKNMYQQYIIVIEISDEWTFHSDG